MGQTLITPDYSWLLLMAPASYTRAANSRYEGKPHIVRLSVEMQR
jgi:hypothetical protein